MSSTFGHIRAPGTGFDREESVCMSVSEPDSRTYTSFFHNDGKMGAASYNEETFELFVFNDTNESTSTFESMVAIIETVKPQSIVYGANNEATVGKYLHRMFSVAAGQAEQLPFRNPENDAGDASIANTQMSNNMLCIPCDIQIPFAGLHRTELVKMSARDFTYANSIERIKCIQFADVNCDTLQNITEEQRFSSLYTYVDFQSTCCVRAIGGLLRFLDRSRIGILPYEPGNDFNDNRSTQFQRKNDGEAAVRFDSIHCVVRQILPLDVQEMVYVSTRTIDSLRIFHSEQSSSAYKRGQNWKEGLSLFRLCNRTVSNAGYQLLYLWFRRPIRNEKILVNRHRTVEFFMRHRRADVTAYLIDRLRNISSIRPILGRMAKGEPSPRDWQEFYTTLFNALGVCEICSNSAVYPPEIDIFGRLAGFSGHVALLHLLQSINDTVDLSQSQKNCRFAVQVGVDAELDEMRRTYGRLTQLLDAEASVELEQLDSRINACAVVYMPQLGFMLQIASSTMTPEIDQAQAHRLTFVFENGGKRHYKSPRTEQLNVQYGDLKTAMNNREQFYQFKLQQLTVKNAAQLAAVIRLCAELDCLISLAITAQQRGFVRPNFSSNGLLEIVKGRHPLQELCTREFVANDLRSGGDMNDIDADADDAMPNDDVQAALSPPEPQPANNHQSRYSRIKILTGPNMSGKSVYMKQVAMIVYMAHVGSFVPADYAVIPFCDRILTQMRAVESTHIPLSAFGLDAMSVNVALRFATRNSLVLLDEFGRGTLVNDGEALLGAAVNYWCRAATQQDGRGCPHVIVSTHFAALHGMVIPESPLIEEITFETRLIPRRDAADVAGSSSSSNVPSLDSKIVQTHKLCKGRTEFNYALLVARNSRNADLTVRARQIMYALQERIPVVPFPMPRVQAFVGLGAQLLNMLCELDLDAAARGDSIHLPDDGGDDQRLLFNVEEEEEEDEDEGASVESKRRRRAVDACCERMINIVLNSDAISLTTATTSVTMKMEEDAEQSNAEAQNSHQNAATPTNTTTMRSKSRTSVTTTEPCDDVAASTTNNNNVRYENVSDQPMRIVDHDGLGYFMAVD